MRIIPIVFLAACQSSPNFVYGDGDVRSFDTTLANCSVLASNDYGGGTPSRITSHYDNAGRMTSQDFNDGIMKYTLTSTFSGNLLVGVAGNMQQSNISLSHHSTYDYDDEGRLVRHELAEDWWEYDVGGGWNRTERQIWEGDRVVRRRIDADNDGGFDFEQSFEWAADERSSTETSDMHDDVIDRTYDADFNLLEVLTTPPEGQLPKFLAYSYNEVEPHWPSRREGGWQDSVDWVLTFTYDCP
jgi:hypothetical protein